MTPHLEWVYNLDIRREGAINWFLKRKFSVAALKVESSPLG